MRLCGWMAPKERNTVLSGPTGAPWRRARRARASAREISAGRPDAQGDHVGSAARGPAAATYRARKSLWTITRVAGRRMNRVNRKWWRRSGCVR